MSPRVLNRTAALLLVVGAIAPVLTSAAGAAVSAFRVPEPVVRRLHNGLTVGVFRDSRLPLVHLQLSVPAGSAAETPRERGAAYLVTQVMGVATASRDATTLNADLDRVGGVIGGQLGRDFATLTLTGLSAQMPAGMELVCDVATRALFSERDFRRALATARTLAERAANPAALAEKTLWEAVFGESPYGHPAYGTPASLDSLTLADVRKFYLARWRPDHAVLAVAGDVDPDSVFAAAERWFEDWNAGNAAAPTAMAVRPHRVTRVEDWPGAEATQVLVGIPGPPSGDADELSMALAVELLNRGSGASEAVHAEQRALRSGGLLWLSAQAPHDSAAAVAARLEARLLALRTTPLGQGALDTLRVAVRRTFPLRFETLEGLASQWCAEASLGFGYAELASFPEHLDSLTPASITAAAARWVDPSRIAVVAVGPEARLLPQFPAVAAAASPAGPAPAAPEAASPAEIARGRDLVRRSISAHGGLSKLKGVRSSVYESEAKLMIAGQPVEARLVETRVEPGRMHVESHMGSMGMVQVLDGDSGWSATLDSASTIRDVDADQLDALRLGFRSDVPHLLIDAADPALNVAARGTVSLNGQTVEKVEVWDASGMRRALYLDPRTRLLAGVEQQDTNPRSEIPSSTRWYGDYRAVNGIRLPFEEDRWVGDQRMMRVTYTRIALNEKVPDGWFKKPEPSLPPTSR